MNIGSSDFVPLLIKLVTNEQKECQPKFILIPITMDAERSGFMPSPQAQSQSILILFSMFVGTSGFMPFLRTLVINRHKYAHAKFKLILFSVFVGRSGFMPFPCVLMINEPK